MANYRDPYQEYYRNQVREGMTNHRKPPSPETCPYTEYYLNQQRGGSMPVFRGTRYQKGHGLGIVFAKLFRHATPLFKRGVSYVGKQALNSGRHIVQDVFAGSSLRTAARRQLKRVGDELVNDAVNYIAPEDQTGSGPRKRRRMNPPRKKRKIPRRKPQVHPDNIF